jgi:hypothetical protein
MIRARFLLPATIALLIMAGAAASRALAGPLPGGGTATTTFASGKSVYVQYPGQYCTDQSGREVYWPALAPVPDGLACTAVGQLIPPLAASTAAPAGAAPAGTPTPGPSH